MVPTIPDKFVNVLGASDEERQRRAREALALELYREGRISGGQWVAGFRQFAETH